MRGAIASRRMTKGRAVALGFCWMQPKIPALCNFRKPVEGLDDDRLAILLELHLHLVSSDEAVVVVLEVVED